MSILVMFNYGQFSNFKSYYNHYLCVQMTDLFPGLVSYNHFIDLQGRVTFPLMLFLKLKGLGSATRISFVDSTPLRSCHNRRIHKNKTFKGIAEQGQCSLGWFFGFKLHLIINDKGKILSIYLTNGNVDDRNLKVMKSMTENLFGKLFGDKGYISKAPSDLLSGNDIQLIANQKRT